MRRIVAHGLVAMVMATSACDSPVGPGESIKKPDARPYVTPDLLSQMDGNGHFTLPEPTAPGRRPIVSAMAARDLGSAFLKSFLANPAFGAIVGLGDPRALLEEAHGHAIKWQDVRVADEPYFAAAYIEVLPDTFPNYVHNHYGPKYLLPLLEHDEQVAALSIAAYATDVTVSLDGYVRFPNVHGNEFRTGGVPHGLEFGHPLTPEAAVAFAATELGVRVAEVPKLQIAEIPWTPLAARWRLVLDSEVEFVRLVDGVRLTSRIVYVGAMPSLAEKVSDAQPFTRRLFVPAAEQPNSERIYVPQVGSGEIVEVAWPVLGQWAPVVNEVAPVKG